MRNESDTSATASPLSLTAISELAARAWKENLGIGQIFEIGPALAFDAHALAGASRRHGVNHGRGLGRDMRFSALRRGQRQIEPVVLIDAARAGLHIERGEAWMVLVVVMHAADMERVARILALQISCADRHRRQRRARACRTRACAPRPTRLRPLSSLIRQAAKITSSTRRSTTASTPSPVLQLVSITGRPRRTSFASLHHQIDIRPDEGRKIGLVDHQQIGSENAEPAFARNIVAAGRIDDEQPIVDELERKGRGEIVAAGLDQHDIELWKSLDQSSRPPECSRSGPRGSRYADRRRSRRQGRGQDRSGPSA